MRASSHGMALACVECDRLARSSRADRERCESHDPPWPAEVSLVVTGSDLAVRANIEIHLLIGREINLLPRVLVPSRWRPVITLSGLEPCGHSLLRTHASRSISAIRGKVHESDVLQDARNTECGMCERLVASVAERLRHLYPDRVQRKEGTSC